MKARWLSAKERAAAKVVAEQLMDKQADDIKTRAEVWSMPPCSTWDCLQRL